MTLESQVGAGTSVSIFLPRFEGVTIAPAALAPTAGPVAGGARQAVVMVVEDEANVREMVCECLAELGMRVLAAEDGDTGLERLRAHADIDLLISDVGLPGLNGRQLADAARAHPGLKVLLMTGYAESAARGSGFLDAGMELIVKPFALDALAQRVQRMLESSGAHTDGARLPTG
ncbi:response regulator [Achromobacter xylosoxidans]